MNMTIGFVPMPIHPITTSVPYTYRQGVTFLEYLETLRTALNELIESDALQSTAYSTLVNDANQAITTALDTVEALSASYDGQLVTMQNLLDAQIADVNTSLAAIQTAIDAADAANDTATALAADFASTTTTFNTRITAVEAFDARIDTLEGAIGSTGADKMVKGSYHHNVKDYGAVGDGVADDTQAIRDASAAAGKNGIVFFPDGKFLVTSKITMPTDQQWMGLGIDYKDSALSTNYILTNITAPDGVAIEATYNTRITNLAFRGSGTGKGLVCYGRVILDNVLVTDYDTGIYCDQLWYGAFYNVNTNRNTIGIDVNRAYNLSIFNPRIYALKGSTPSYGIEIKTNCDVRIYGGAIEGYTTGINFQSVNNVHLALFGVYFELSDLVAPTGYAGAVAIDARYTEGSTIQAIGCYNYINNQRYFIDVYGANVECNVHAMGNYFKGGQPASIGYQHNAYRWQNNSKAKMYLSGDSWQGVTNPANALYYTPTLLPNGNSIICPPNDSQNNGMPNNMVYSGGKNFTTGSGYDVLGQTTVLPAMPTIDKSNTHKGAMMFYTPTNKPIVWNGATWTYFDGSAVT